MAEFKVVKCCVYVARQIGIDMPLSLFVSLYPEQTLPVLVP